MLTPELDQLADTTSPVGKTALVDAVYNSVTPKGAVRTALQMRKLINHHGQPTPLGRALADHLLATRKDQP